MATGPSGSPSSLCITCSAGFPSQNWPTDSSDQAKFLSSRFTNVGIMRRAGACGQPFEVGQHATPAEGAILAVRWIEVQFTRRYWVEPVPAWRVGVALITPAGESYVSPLHGLAPVALWFGRLA